MLNLHSHSLRKRGNGRRDTVVFAQHALGLVPEVLDAVDVMAAGADEGLGVVDAPVLEARHVQNVIAAEAVGIDDRVR